MAWAGEKPRRNVAKRSRKSAPRKPSRGKQFLPQAVAEIPWGHNVALLEQLKDSTQRTWYARQVTANGWSRSVLEHWIDSDLYSRKGNAVTNFKQALPLSQSDLADEIVRNPPLLRRHRFEDNNLQTGIRRKNELLPLGGRRSTAPRRGSAINRTDFLQDTQQSSSGIRLTQCWYSDGSRALHHPTGRISAG